MKDYWYLILDLLRKEQMQKPSEEHRRVYIEPNVYEKEPELEKKEEQKEKRVIILDI